MKLAPFEFTRAESLDHALGLLGEDAKVVAGGQSLIPLMAFRLATPSHLVDVSDLAETRYVRNGPDGLAVGGTTRHAELEQADLGPEWRAFAEALPLIGHLPIRTRGTIGGSIAHADPTAELPLLACTFDATIVVQSRSGRRELPAADFFRGTMTTALEPTELIVEVRFPAPPPGTVSAFEEFSERAGDFALASVCVAAARDEDGVCTWIRVGLGAVASTPVRSPAAEAALLGSRLDAAAVDEACALLADEINPPGGLHAPAEYRAELAAVMLRRATSRVRAQ
ncbi:MAG TPA: xanthine dehydrogenase family protein subunit M [Gaiellaceae bacterium]|nr:xanthine dehydrogenase family protein subunit M [Gaiellaceae bacterium]